MMSLKALVCSVRLASGTLCDLDQLISMVWALETTSFVNKMLNSTWLTLATSDADGLHRICQNPHMA